MSFYLKTTLKVVPLIFVFSLVFSSCSSDDNGGDAVPSNIIQINAGVNAADEAQLVFIEVESGQIIQFGSGTFTFTNTLSMDNKDTIIIRGAGRDKTILDFSSQTAGGDGVLVTNCRKYLTKRIL